MKIQHYLSKLSVKEKRFVQKLRRLILETDPSVKEELGSIMAIKNTLNYTQQGVFKYGLSVTQHHISFHSMVLYANPSLVHYLKRHLKQAKFKKGCVNIHSYDDFPEEILKKHLDLSSVIDFTPIINRYDKRK